MIIIEKIKKKEKEKTEKKGTKFDNYKSTK